MASNTRETMNKRKWKLSGQNKRRKRADRKQSTPSAAELFAQLGVPGQPLPKKK